MDKTATRRTLGGVHEDVQSVWGDEVILFARDDFYLDDKYVTW